MLDIKNKHTQQISLQKLVVFDDQDDVSSRPQEGTARLWRNQSSFSGKGAPFLPHYVLQGKGNSMGSLWEGWDVHRETKMFPESKRCLASLPYQQQNNCIATSTGYFLAHYSPPRENTPRAPCLLCQFCQTGVESACQVRSNTCWHFPAHAVHHVGSWRAASWLQRSSPLPHFLSQGQHAITISKCACELPTGQVLFRSSDLLCEYWGRLSNLCFAFSGALGAHSQSRITVESTTKRAQCKGCFARTICHLFASSWQRCLSGPQQWHQRTHPNQSTFPLSRGCFP